MSHMRQEALAAHFEDWQPTPEAVNELPEPLRRYIHRLESLSDPAGLVRENVLEEPDCCSAAKAG